jgi:hypothetical protein
MPLFKEESHLSESCALKHEGLWCGPISRSDRIRGDAARAAAYENGLEPWIDNAMELKMNA